MYRSKNNRLPCPILIATHYGWWRFIVCAIKGTGFRLHKMPWVNTFQHACSMGNIREMVLLLNRGHVDLEMRDVHGETVLQRAIHQNGTNACGVIDKLLEHRANPFTINDHGENTLHAAANHNNPGLVRKLIDLGVDADLVCTRHGITPLHIAALYSCVDVVQLLIECGVDQSQKDPGVDNEMCHRGGWTALDYARENIRFHELRMTGKYPRLFHRFASYIHRKWDGESRARHETVMMLEVEELHNANKLAFAMGHHQRLEENSMLGPIDPGVLRLILEDSFD